MTESSAGRCAIGNLVTRPFHLWCWQPVSSCQGWCSVAAWPQYLRQHQCKSQDVFPPTLLPCNMHVHWRGWKQGLLTISSRDLGTVLSSPLSTDTPPARTMKLPDQHRLSNVVVVQQQRARHNVEVPRSVACVELVASNVQHRHTWLGVRQQAQPSSFNVLVVLCVGACCLHCKQDRTRYALKSRF